MRWLLLFSVMVLAACGQQGAGVTIRCAVPAELETVIEDFALAHPDWVIEMGVEP